MGVINAASEVSHRAKQIRVTERHKPKTLFSYRGRRPNVATAWRSWVAEVSLTALKYRISRATSTCTYTYTYTYIYIHMHISLSLFISTHLHVYLHLGGNKPTFVMPNMNLHKPLKPDKESCSLEPPNRLYKVGCRLRTYIKLP